MEELDRYTEIGHFDEFGNTVNQRIASEEKVLRVGSSLSAGDTGDMST